MTGQVYKYKDSITLSANAQSVETTSFYTTNTAFVNVMLNRSNADRLLVEGTDYTIEKISNDIQSLVRVTAIGSPFLSGDTLTFILNKDSKTTLSFTAESVREITPSNLQNNNEGTLETVAAVLGEREEAAEKADTDTLQAAKTYADGQDAIHSAADRQFTDDQDAAHSQADRAYTDREDMVHSQDDRAYTDNKINETTNLILDELDSRNYQGVFRIYLYRQVAHGADAPTAPQGAIYNDRSGEITSIPSGWQSTFFTSFNDAAFDYYESFAEFNPRIDELGDWSTPFVISADTGGVGPPGRKGDTGKQGEPGPIGPQPTLALGTGVAEVGSYVLYQHPSLPLDSTVPAKSFLSTLLTIENENDVNHMDYMMPSTIAAFTADGAYSVRDIRHDGATRRCLVLKMKERLDTYTNIHFYTAPNTNDFPSPSTFGAKELSLYTEEDESYIIENLALHSGSSYKGFVAFSDGDKEIYIYQVGPATEYLGWVNLDRIAAMKGDKGDPPDLTPYSTTAQVDAKDAATLQAAKDYTDENGGDEAPAHFVRTVRKEGTSVSDKDYYVENVAEITQTDEFYIVNPVVAQLGTIPDANAGNFAIKASNGTITYTAPSNGDTAHVYADRQVDITDTDGNVSQANENKIIAVLIYEGQWIITNSFFKTANNVTETGAFANAEGGDTTAGGDYSHSEGRGCTASGTASHAEGWFNTVSGGQAHVEGSNNIASGQASHAEGASNISGGTASHAGGRGNTTSVDDSFVTGMNAVLGDPNTLMGVGYSQVIPDSNQKEARTDLNMKWKADRDGNTTQTGTVTATDFVKTDGTAVANPPQQFALSKTFKAGETFYYGTDNRVLLFLVRPGQTFHGQTDAAAWSDSTWSNYIFKSTNTSGKILLIADVSNVGHIVSMTNAVDSNNRLTTTINYEDSEDNAVSVSTTPIQLPNAGANKAIEALASDMEWAVEVQNYNDASAPASPATIGLGYRIFAAGASNESHRIDFIFPTATTKADVDALVIGRKFVIEVPEGVITFEPTSHVATAVVSGGYHRERYDGDITPNFTGFTNVSNTNNNYQTTLYRGLETLAEIADGSVTTPKIAGAAVTEVKLSADVISKLNASASAFSGHGIVLTRLSTPTLLTSSSYQNVPITLPRGKNIRDYDRIIFKMTGTGEKAEYFARGIEIDSSTASAAIVLAGFGNNKLSIYSPTTNNISIKNDGSFSPNIVAEVIAADFTGEKGDDGDDAPTTFTGLTDTPAALTGQGGKFVQVNTGATALEFVDAPSGGGGGGSVNHFIRTVRKKGTSRTDGMYYVRNVAEIVQTDEYYIVDPQLGVFIDPFTQISGDIPNTNKSHFAIKDAEGVITYTAPNNGDGAFVYADAQFDGAAQNKLVAFLIYEGSSWIQRINLFKNSSNRSKEIGLNSNDLGNANTIEGDNSASIGTNNKTQSNNSLTIGINNYINPIASASQSSGGGTFNSMAVGRNNTIRNHQFGVLFGINGVMSEENTRLALSNGANPPNTSEVGGEVDVNLVWKVDKDGNSKQTGTVTADAFMTTDGRAVTSGSGAIGLFPITIWDAESVSDIIQVESGTVKDISAALGQNTFIQLFYSTGDSDMPFNSRLIKLSDLAITDGADKADYTLAIFSVDGSKNIYLAKNTTNDTLKVLTTNNINIHGYTIYNGGTR